MSILFFQRKLKKPDPEAEQKLRDEIGENGGLEKKDLPAMIISAFLVILPAGLAVMLLFAILAWLFF